MPSKKERLNDIEKWMKRSTTNETHDDEVDFQTAWLDEMDDSYERFLAEVPEMEET